MYKRRLVLGIIVGIFVMSIASFISMLLYFDPYIAPRLALGLLLTNFVLAVSSFLTLVFYFCKKIYFRGEVYMYHIVSSARQSFFSSIWILGVLVLYSFEMPIFLPAFLLFCVILFLELFIQNM